MPMPMTLKNYAADPLKLSLPIELAALARRLTVRAGALDGVRSLLTDEILRPLESLDAQRESAAAAVYSGDSGPAGRTKRVKNALEETEAALAAFNARLAPILAEVESLRSAMLRPKPVNDPMVAIQTALRHQEIRAGLAGLDQLQRDRLFLETEDLDIIEAMASAPPTLFHAPGSTSVPVWQGFVSVEHVASRRLALAAAANPEQAADLADAEAIANLLTSTLATARTSIRNAIEIGTEA